MFRYCDWREHEREGSMTDGAVFSAVGRVFNGDYATSCYLDTSMQVPGSIRKDGLDAQSGAAAFSSSV